MKTSSLMVFLHDGLEKLLVKVYLIINLVYAVIYLGVTGIDDDQHLFIA